MFTKARGGENSTLGENDSKVIAADMPLLSRHSPSFMDGYDVRDQVQEGEAKKEQALPSDFNPFHPRQKMVP